MSNMSSFYGGRPGAPFVIVKTFDAVKVPTTGEDNKIYTKSYYALDEHGNYYITDNKKGNVQLDENHFLVKKTAENYYEYNWKLAINDGITKINQTELTFPEELAEGMINCFEKGVSTLDEVNYQEYVLIDTVTNLNEYLNPDNGKLFRRGLNINNDMYGAEYVGRIVGAQGYNTGIQLDTFDNINSNTLNQIIKGTTIANLLPGSNLEIENNQLKEGQGIECIYANILDEGGNVLQTKIGFKFPYLVNTFKASQVSPYNVSEDENLITEIKENGEVLQNSTDNPNPFYRHWSIKIPHGKKGDSIELVRKQPTLAPAGINYYTSLHNLKNNISPITLESSVEISSDKYLIDEENENKVAYIQLDTNKFVKVEDCTNNKVFYIIRNYDTTEEGSVSIPFEVGDINSIVKTDLADDGTLTIYYDNGEEEKAKNRINFIKEVYIGTTDDAAINNKVKPNCLYVRYSDPDYFLREEDYIEINGKKWVELGILTPHIQGQKFIGTYNEFPNDKLHTPPEDMTGSITGYGGLILVSGIIYVFDYLTNTWRYSGTSMGTVEDAGKIVSISAQNGSPNPTGNLPNSIRFGTNQINAR